MKTQFNKDFPGAYDIQFGSNGQVWGVWFRLPNSNRRIFKSFCEFQDKDSNSGVLERYETLPNENFFLYQEDRNLHLN